MSRIRHTRHPTSSSSGAESSAWSRPGGPRSAGCAIDRRRSRAAAAGPPRWRPGMLAAVTELHYGEQTLLGPQPGVRRAATRTSPPSSTEATRPRPRLPRAAARSPSRSTPTTAPICANCTPCSAGRGLDSEWLTGRECRRLEPMLAPGVRGGLRVDGDHQVDPRRLAAALVAACERAGVVFHRAWAERLSVVRRPGGRRPYSTTATELRRRARSCWPAGSLSGRLGGRPGGGAAARTAR